MARISRPLRRRQIALADWEPGFKKEGEKMSERTVKLCSVEQAASLVSDGDRVAFGGFAIYQKPMAAVQELIRAGRKDLTIVGCVNSIEADMLIGAGCVSTIETSYVGLEKYGLAKNYRRFLQEGKLRVVHYPEMLAWDRFRADREGMPFWPVYFLGGNDVLKDNPDIVPFTCPVTGKQAWAVPAAAPDVVVIHAYQGDRYGNVQIQERSMLPQYLNIDMARACRKLIVTVEKIVETEEIRKNPHLTLIPAFRTAAISHVPFGSHPTSTLSATQEDDRHFQEYLSASSDEQSFGAYLDRYVRNTKDFKDYLALIGASRLRELEVLSDD